METKSNQGAPDDPVRDRAEAQEGREVGRFVDCGLDGMAGLVAAGAPLRVVPDSQLASERFTNVVNHLVVFRVVRNKDGLHYPIIMAFMED